MGPNLIDPISALLNDEKQPAELHSALTLNNQKRRSTPALALACVCGVSAFVAAATNSRKSSSSRTRFHTMISSSCARALNHSVAIPSSVFFAAALASALALAAATCAAVCGLFGNRAAAFLGLSSPLALKSLTLLAISLNRSLCSASRI